MVQPCAHRSKSKVTRDKNGYHGHRGRGIAPEDPRTVRAPAVGLATPRHPAAVLRAHAERGKMTAACDRTGSQAACEGLLWLLGCDAAIGDRVGTHLPVPVAAPAIRDAVRGQAAGMESSGTDGYKTVTSGHLPRQVGRNGVPCAQLTVEPISPTVSDALARDRTRVESACTHSKKCQRVGDLAGRYARGK